jgi:exosortase
MERIPRPLIVDAVLWPALPLVFSLQYLSVLKSLYSLWLSDAQLAYGAFVPILVVYLIWTRRHRLQGSTKSPWPMSLLIIIAGSGLQVLASLSETLVFSGIALAATLIGTVGFLWGRQCLRITAVPLGFLALIVPLPSYLVDQITWQLKVIASTFSANVLGIIGIPVYQDGNLITLPNYVLEVKDVCSGSRSIFALLTIALVLALTMEEKWRHRVLLIACAPILAILINVLRIVGTGLVAWRYGALAANESLHTVWGVLVFAFAVTILLGFQRFLQWAAREYA